MCLRKCTRSRRGGNPSRAARCVWRRQECGADAPKTSRGTSPGGDASGCAIKRSTAVDKPPARAGAGAAGALCTRRRSEKPLHSNGICRTGAARTVIVELWDVVESWGKFQTIRCKYRFIDFSSVLTFLLRHGSSTTSRWYFLNV